MQLPWEARAQISGVGFGLCFRCGVFIFRVLPDWPFVFEVSCDYWRADIRPH